MTADIGTGGPCGCAPGYCASFCDPVESCVMRLTGDVRTMPCAKCHPPDSSGTTWHQDGECLRCRAIATDHAFAREDLMRRLRRAIDSVDENAKKIMADRDEAWMVAFRALTALATIAEGGDPETAAYARQVDERERARLALVPSPARYAKPKETP